MNLYISLSHDPFYNASLENWLFNEILDYTSPILYLWRNKPCIVIGRSQNPWIECNIPNLYKHKIPIIRRCSGGGSVYHDLGNLNYTIMYLKNSYNKINNSFNIIFDILHSFGIKFNISSRYDLLIQFLGKQYKFSGNAFRDIKDRYLHHGTLLINSDINKIYNYLHHQYDKNLFTNLNNTSYRSEVINLSVVTNSLCLDDILKAFIHYCTTCIYLPDTLSYHVITEEINKLKSWHWSFAKTLPFVKILYVNGYYIMLKIINGRVIVNINNNLFMRFNVWINLLSPKYIKNNFFIIPKHFNSLESKAMQILFNDIPNIYLHI